MVFLLRYIGISLPPLAKPRQTLHRITPERITANLDQNEFVKWAKES